MSEIGTIYNPPVKVDENLWMVPCKIDPISQKFIPIIDPKASDKSCKSDWTEPEEKLLEELILFKGSKKWTTIASKLNEVFHCGKNLRLGKHCRERWLNHLDPSLKKGEWSPEEDQIILANQAKIGNKWSLITKLLPGRTENQVKNRWKSIFRKASKSFGNGIPSIQVEWGGEVGSGFGFDCEEMITIENDDSLNINCYTSDVLVETDYYEYLDSPSFFFN